MADAQRVSTTTRLIEYFTLTRAERAARGVDRGALSRELDAVRRAVNDAADRWADSDPEPALSALADAEARYHADVEPLFTDAAALATLTGYRPPTRDDRTTVSTFSARFARLDRATRALGGVAGGPFARWSARALRLSILALVLATAGRFVVDRAKRPTLRATASATWGDVYGARHIADGDPETSWLLPDHTAGWARVAFSSRSIRQIRLFSVRRLSSYGAQQCSIEVERRGQIVHSQRVDLVSTVGQRAPFVYRLPAATDADAVRVHIHTWHALGGGLSEIEIE